MAPLSWILIGLTLVVEAKVLGMARRAWPRMNGIQRWLTVVWMASAVPPLAVEGAIGLAEPYARVAAGVAVAIQAGVGFAVRRYSRTVGLPPEAAGPARDHVLALHGLTAAYLPVLLFPTELTAFVMLFSGIWLIAPLYAWALGAQLWRAVRAWS